MKKTKRQVELEEYYNNLADEIEDIQADGYGQPEHIEYSDAKLYMSGYFCGDYNTSSDVSLAQWF